MEREKHDARGRAVRAGPEKFADAPARRRARTGRILLSTTALLLSVVSIGRSQAYFESYFLFLGNAVDEKVTGYHEDVQGITHDENNWFITQSDADDSDPAERSVWKIPVTHDLNSVSPNDQGVIRVNLDDIPDLANRGYNHFGDLSYYNNKDFDGQGYLVIPVTGGKYGVIAVFRSSDLGYVGSAELLNGTEPGWCAVDPDGYLYTSGSTIGKVEMYRLRWDLIPNEVKLEPVREFSLYDEVGHPLTIEMMQGGVISESGRLLYTVSGFYDQSYANDGINVFELVTGRRIRRSTNGYGHFNYEFHSDINAEEPEGITIWDLDDGRAPGIRGQLHVLMLDNELLSADDVYLKDYTNVIHVDKNYSGSEDGSYSNPFTSVTKAYSHYPIWDGAELRIHAGSYDETLVISKRIRITAEGGAAIIGQ